MRETDDGEETKTGSPESSGEAASCDGDLGVKRRGPGPRKNLTQELLGKQDETELEERNACSFRGDRGTKEVTREREETSAGEGGDYWGDVLEILQKTLQGGE